MLEEAKLYYDAARQSAGKGRKPSPLRSLTGPLAAYPLRSLDCKPPP